MSDPLAAVGLWGLGTRGLGMEEVGYRLSALGSRFPTRVPSPHSRFPSPDSRL